MLWWYLLPPTIGVLVATWGMHINLYAKIPGTLAVIAIDVFVYWLNQWARSKQLLPLEAQLASLLHSAETGEPLDETQVANLRPIVLSMATADHVKPAEFKVAFWQIAIYGEIGFLGMWFFLMLGLSEGKFSQMFNWQHLVWSVPFFLGGLLFSRLLQTTTCRALGVSTVGVHLCKGQDLLLWDEIKAVQPVRVLNIHYLWLIRKSGEKALMPWTSLERHSELKAAVEKFAPPSHPIREYLPLLGRI